MEKCRQLEDEGNVEKMRLLSNKLRNVEIVKTLSNIVRTHGQREDVVCSTTDINLFRIQSDNKSFHNPKLLDVSNPGLSMWFQPVTSSAASGKFYRLPPDKENTGLSGFIVA